jgi:hypothetical protein
MTDTIGSIYSEYIKEQFIKEKLKNGEIPSVEEIELSVRDLRISSDNFNSPRTKEIDYRLDLEEKSSAKKMNGMFSTLGADLGICVKSLLKQGNQLTNLYNSAFTRLEGLEKKIEKSSSKVQDFLFASKNSDRHEDLFYERFESTQMVDLVASTAQVDDLSNSVVLKETSKSVIPLNGSIESVGSTHGSVLTSTDVTGLEVSNIANSTNEIWQHQVRTKENVAQIYVDVIIRIPSSSKEINQVVIDPSGADAKTQANIEVSHSTDRLNWEFPDGESKKRLNKRTTFSFANKAAEYWRLRITKFGNDGFFGDAYVYNFGLKNVLLLGKQYDKIDRSDISYLYSKIIKPEKLDRISQISLKICESLSSGTEIKYEVSPLTESQVLDIESGGVTKDEFKYYLADLKDNESFILDMLKLSSESGTDDILAVDTIDYKGRREFDFGLDYSLDSSESKDDLVLLRNQGDNIVGSVLGKAAILNENERGWNFDGQDYSTYVMVNSEDGEEIDLGSTRMIINGKAQTGVVELKIGLNHIVTDKKNWYSLDLATVPPTSSVLVDQLYPYNHKYIIEGMGNTLYGRDMTQEVDSVSILDIVDPDKVYRSRKEYWSIKMKEKSIDIFESNKETSLDIFSYKLDNNNEERIIIKSSSENGLLNSERFSIITKIEEANPVKGIIFKATLSTDNIKKTPVLTEYLLKFR